MDREALQALAKRQLSDFDARNPGTAFAGGLKLTLTDAYRLQLAFAALRQQRGDFVTGYKVGCTSTNIRRQLNIDHSVFGHLFDCDSWPSGVEVPASQFASPAIEGELAVRLRADVSVPLTDDQWQDAIESVFPVIELHHMVFRRGRSSVEELVGNNAIHAGYVYPRKQLSGLELTEARMDISINQQPPVSVQGNCLTRTIFDSLNFLVPALAQHQLQLCAGQVVLCGSIADLFPIFGKTHVQVTTDRFGDVAFTMVESPDKS